MPHLAASQNFLLLRYGQVSGRIELQCSGKICFTIYLTTLFAKSSKETKP